MNFQPIEFVNNLKWLGLGMLGILIVMGVIIGVTLLLNYLTSGKSEDTADDNDWSIGEVSTLTTINEYLMRGICVRGICLSLFMSEKNCGKIYINLLTKYINCDIIYM